MKKILLLTSAFATIWAFLAGCTESAEVGDVFSLSQTALKADVGGGEFTVNVQSKCDWTAECSADWIIVSPAAGQAGKGTLTVTVLPNHGTETRNAEITIGNIQYDILNKIAVTQEKFSPEIETDTKEIRCDVVGKTLTVTVESNIEWTAECSADWVTVSPAAGQAGKSTLTVKVEGNFSAESRNAEITIGNEQYDIFLRIKVEQEANDEFTSIPDDVFRTYLLENFDSDGDRRISKNECKTIESIDCSGKNISSLQGIEYFTALKSLICSETEITALDLSQNPRLLTLNCHNTEITALDLSNNPDLQYLACYNTEITALDLSKNPDLETLSCYDTELTALDLSKNTNLKYLYCNGTKLMALDLSQNPRLLTLDYHNTGITALDLSNNPDLQYLWCFDTEITALDLSKNPDLYWLNCNRTKLTALDLSKNPDLQWLNCNETKLTALDLSRNPDLWSMDCSGTEITELDLSKNPNLNGLSCSKTKLTVLDLSQNTELISLYCDLNPQLKTIYLKTGQNIETLKKDKTTQIVYK